VCIDIAVTEYGPCITIGCVLPWILSVLRARQYYCASEGGKVWIVCGVVFATGESVIDETLFCLSN
jgi:hypothetical protein